MISVCMASYNGAQFIKQQLDSILGQLSPNDEIIISDDSSTDETVTIVEAINDSRIKLLKGNAFRSPIYNLENALKNAIGDIIFLADQDDVWKENKVEVSLESLERYDIVVSDCEVVDINLNVIYPSFFQLNSSRRGLLSNLMRNSYLGCCMAFHKRVLGMVLPFPKQIPMHDIWIGFVGDLLFKTYFINEKLILYRRHGKNESPTAEKSPYSIGEKLRFRMPLLIKIPNLILKRMFENSK